MYSRLVMNEIREMRRLTDQHLSVVDCRDALLATGGNVGKALEWARSEKYRQARKFLPRGASTQLNW